MPSLYVAWIPSCFTVSGSENDRQNFPLTRSTLRYSAPSVAFSDWRSPVRVSVPSLTSRWKSSFFIPGSSARIRYASLLSKTSTGGYQVTEFGFSQVRLKLSPNRSLIRACIRFKLSNGSHLTNSIYFRPPLDPLFDAEKLSTRLKAVNHLTEVQRVLKFHRGSKDNHHSISKNLFHPQSPKSMLF